MTAVEFKVLQLGYCTMKCPHCAHEIHFKESETFVYKDSEPKDALTGYDIAHGFCPSCNNLIVLFRRGILRKNMEPAPPILANIHSTEIIYPKTARARPLSVEVPKDYRNDFIEAESVLPASPKASAAISRRLLQDILRNDFGLKAANLAQEIDAFLKLPGIPTYITEAVDAIRNVGNFAAHPLKNQNTGQIIEVEPGEAEWLLEVLESLFDFQFVQPKRLSSRRSALNTKLTAAGKPQMK